jgi:peptidoglycan-N-acetylglucosamine deacetylase
MANCTWLGPVIRRFASEGNELWLTIDDGPAADTAAVLQILAEANARATFFVKGTSVRRHPELIAAIDAAGSTVANHSDTHPSARFWCLGPRAIAREIDACSRAIEQLLGTAPRLFRAPVGMKNPFVHPLLRRRGMLLIGWSRRAFDTVSRDADAIVRRATSTVRPGDIILIHQGGDIHVECIRRIVGDLTCRGFRFVIPRFDQLAV